MQTAASHRSLWLAVTIGVIGLVAGYSLFLSQNGTVFAAGRSCPMHDNQKVECQDGNCSEDCPGNCDHRNA